MHRRVTFLMLVLMLGCGGLAYSGNVEKAPGLEYAIPRRECAVLPASASRYLKKVMPAYAPVSPPDYDPDWFDSRSEYYAPDMAWFNWILRADFDGNGQEDYVLLMRGTIDGTQHVALVAVRATKNGWTRDVLEDSAWSHPVREAVYLNPPGNYGLGLADDPEPEMKALFTPSFVCSALESCGANHYYWEKGTWKRVGIGL